MKLQRIAAGILAAVMLTAAGTAGTRGNGFCVVSEAASKLAAPEITSTSSTTSTVTLKWGKVSGADGYIIYKADRITKKFEEYKKVASEKCKVTGLLSGAAYRFQVAAFTDTKGKISVQKKTDIIKVTTQKLPAPGSLKASASDSTVKLTWNKVTGADKYRVYMYDSASGKYKEYAETEDTSYTAEGLVNGKSYKFMTAAVVSGEGSEFAQKYSGVVTSKPFKKDVQLQIKDFTVYDAAGKKYKLSDYTGKPIVLYFWTRDGFTTGYELKNLDELYKKYNDRVNFLFINCEHKSLLNFVKEYLAEGNYSFPMLYDWELIALWQQGSYAVPRTVLIKDNGALYKTYDTYMSAATIEELILKML